MNVARTKLKKERQRIRVSVKAKSYMAEETKKTHKKDNKCQTDKSIDLTLHRSKENDYVYMCVSVTECLYQCVCKVFDTDIENKRKQR